MKAPEQNLAREFFIRTLKNGSVHAFGKERGMKKRWFIVLTAVAMSSLSLIPAVLNPANAEISLHYEFSSSSATYTPITGGTVHGTPSNDDHNFNAIDLSVSPSLLTGWSTLRSAFRATALSPWGLRCRIFTHPSAPVRATTLSLPLDATFRATGRTRSCSR